VSACFLCGGELNFELRCTNDGGGFAACARKTIHAHSVFYQETAEMKHKKVTKQLYISNKNKAHKMYE